MPSSSDPLLPSALARPAPGGSVRVDEWLRRLSGASADATYAAAPPRDGAIRAALVALLAMVMLGPLMTISGGNISAEGNAVRQIGYLLILAFSLYATWPTLNRRNAIALSGPLLIAFGWCWLSIGWALDPSIAVRRLILTNLIAWMVFNLVRAGGYRTTTETLRYTLLATVLISYGVVVLLPATGIHLLVDTQMPTALVGNWRGFLGHKNFAGAVCALCIIMFLFDARRLPGLLRLFVVLAAGYFLYRSQSKTSMGMLVMAVLGGYVFETVNFRLRAYLMPILAVATAVIGGLTSAYQDMFVTTVLNPSAFTGRGLIWSALLKYASDHPMLGAGFGSFWNIDATSPIFQYGIGYVRQITVGHSGYLDQLVAVGVPGVVLMVLAVAAWPLARLLASNRLAPGQGGLIAAMLLFCIGHNVTESGLFERDGIVSTILFLVAALAQYGTDGTTVLSFRAPATAARQRTEGDDVMRTMRRRQRARQDSETATPEV